jgi:hypothetical protein
MNRLDEKLGVPDNIVKLAIEIRAEILKLVDGIPSRIMKSKFNIKNQYKILLGSYDIDISDLSIKEFKFYITLNYFEGYQGNPELIGASYNNNIRYKDVKDIVIDTSDVTSANIGINVAIGKFGNIKQGILDSIKKLNSSVIAHELMHLYDSYKSKYNTIKSRSEYQSYQEVKFPGVISNFLHMLYYMTSIEMAVRPAEVYTDLVDNNITRKEFKQFMDSNKVMAMVKKARDFSLDEFREKIDADLELVNLLDNLVADGYERVSNDGISYDILYILLNNLFSEQAQVSNDLYKMYVRGNVVDFINSFFKFLNKGTDDEQAREKKADESFKKFVKSLMKYKDNPIKYFEELEKYLNFVGDKMYRKLNKLYGMLNEQVRNKCIIDWELYQSGNSYKIITKMVDFESLTIKENKENKKDKK